MDGVDRISDLPALVIEKILEGLPLADAARTSVLSRKWRNKWAEAPQLLFDRNFVSDLQKRQGIVSDAQLMTTIYEVLLLHLGSVNKFTLSIPQLESCPEIDRVIRFLSNKGIQHFKLSILSGDEHKLPSHMFSCMHLQCLKLYSCIFEPPRTFVGFNKLVSLDLQKVHLNDDFFEVFISKCPQLERLVLNGCIWTECCRIEIDAPNLKLLNYSGAYKSVCFKNTPSLKVASIYETTGEYPQIDRRRMVYLDEVLNGLVAIESLSVDYYFIKIIAVRDVSKRFAATLNCLKVLEAFDLCLADVDQVSSLFGLIRSSPNLEDLRIEMNADTDLGINSTLKVLSVHDFTTFSLNKLQKVNIHAFNGTKSEMELIKFLLGKLPALKRMNIRLHDDMRDSEQQLNLLKEMIQFQRASPTAEIVYGC